MRVAEIHHTDRIGPRAALHRSLGPILLLLLTIGFYWKLVLTDQYTWLDSPDIAYMEMPRFQFQASEWHHLRFPAWDPYQWCGQPMLGQINGAAYPLNWPLFLLGFRDGKIRQDHMHWYFVLMHFLAALFAWWLCRDLGCSPAASTLGACLFSFGGYVATSDWPEVLGGSIWAPLVFLFLLRAARGHRALGSAALSGMLVGISWLSGHHQSPYYLSLAGAAAWLTWWLKRRDWPTARLAAVWLLFLVLAGGFQLVPGYEYGRLALRWAGAPEALRWNQPVPYSVHADFAFTPAEWLAIVVPRESLHVSPLAGVVGFALALLGVAAGWRHTAVRLFTLVGLAGLLFAMSRHNILYGVLYGLAPMFEKARVPARLLFLFSAAVAPLAAFGFDAILEEGRGRVMRRVLTVAGAGVWAILIGLQVAGRGTPDDRFAMAGLVALLFAALLAGWERGRIYAGGMTIVVIFMLLVELGSLQNWPSRFDEKHASQWKELFQHNDIAQFIKGRPDLQRAIVNENEIRYNFGDWHGIETLGGYMAGVTENIVGLATFTERAQDLLGAGFAVSKTPTRAGQIEVFEGSSGIKVWRNANAFPRAWTVHETIQLPSPQAARERIQDPTVDLRRTALLSGPPPPLAPAAGEDSIEWEDRKAGQFVLRAHMASRGLLIMSDTYFPGWVAEIDRESVPILEVDGALRGVVVDAGPHRIEMRYRPWSMRIGALMTLVGLVGALSLVLFSRTAA